MSIETLCDQCGMVLSVSDEHAGGRARCPQCQTEYDVPLESDFSALNSACHFCGAAMDEAASVDVTSDEPFAICPECRVSIETNECELAEAAEQNEYVNNIFFVIALGIGALVLIVCLTKWFFSVS